MTKAKLEFDLDDEQDRYSFKIASNYRNIALFVDELRSYFRQRYKHDEPPEVKTAMEEYEEMETEIWDLLLEHNMSDYE